MVIIISSQRYLDDAIVADKLAASDFEVALSPEFAYEGDTYQVVLDGHHSLAAAREAGVDPVFVDCDPRIDTLYVLEREGPEAFLERVWMDSDWYDIDTGANVW